MRKSTDDYFVESTVICSVIQLVPIREDAGLPHPSLVFSEGWVSKTLIEPALSINLIPHFLSTLQALCGFHELTQDWTTEGRARLFLFWGGLKCGDESPRYRTKIHFVFRIPGPLCGTWGTRSFGEEVIKARG